MNTTNDWHTISAEETANRLNVNPYRGLSEREARKRRSKFGKNGIWYVRRMETGKAILLAAGDLSTVLLIISALLALLFEEWSEAVTMCGILILGALLRVVTYVKAKRILEDNASENIPTAAVLRDGSIRLISAVDVVPGDIVLLHQGDTVPCDGRVISNHDTLVSEANVTENKDQVHKYNIILRSKPGSAAIPCENRPNILYAGSTVLEGDPVMIATSTGDDTLISMKQDGIEIPSDEHLPLIDRLNGWCKVSELVMLAFVVLISALSLFMGSSLRLDRVFFIAVSTAAASMSEYLTTIGYIIIAIAVRTSAGTTDRKQKTRHGAVIKDCTKLENIASAESIILGDISLLKSGKASLNTYFAGGKRHSPEALATERDGLSEILSLVSEAVGMGAEDSALAKEGAEKALRERDHLVLQGAKLFRESTNEPLTQKNHIIDHIKGESSLAAGLDISIVQPNDTKNGPYVTAAGDVQSILRCCSTYKTKKGEIPLTGEVRKAIFTEVVRIEYIGAKILAVATRPAPYLTLTKLPSLLTDMCFAGFFSLSEMPAEGVTEAVRELKQAGTRVILLSDNPDHDLYYGHDLGLFNKETKIVPHTEFSEEHLTGKSLIVTVPAYKHTDTAKDLAAASARYKVLRRANVTNAAFFTKDALDSRALGTSGCGIAVSRSGRKSAAQSLKNQAKIIVYPNAEEEHGGFTEGIEAIKEARRAILNMANASLYLTAAQLTRLFLLLAGVLLGLPMLSPTAILASGLIFDFGAVLVMAFEKAPENVLATSCPPLPKLRAQIKGTALFSLSSAVLSVFMPLLINGAAPLLHVHSLKDKEAVALLTASLFFCQLALAIRFMKRGRLLRRKVSVSSATLSYASLLSVITVLLLFEGHVSSVFGGAPVPWYAAPLSLIPGVILFFVVELAALFIEKKRS